LVIHNIEGSGLRDADSLKALAALVLNSDAKDSMRKEDKDTYCNRVVQLVASIDHVDAVSFLDMEAMTNFSWVSGLWKKFLSVWIAFFIFSLSSYPTYISFGSE
jgi:hypothetical protein